MSETQSNNTYWFYKLPLWLRIVLCIFLLPIFIPILVWPKLKMPILGKIIILIIWIIFISIITGSSSTTENSSKDIVLNITGISQNEIKKDDKLAFKIKTDPLTVDEVTINGESATKVGWDTEYSLEKIFPEGENTITVVAKKGDQKTEKVFNFKIDLSEKKKAEEVKKNRTIEQKIQDLSVEIFSDKKGYSSVYSSETAILNFNVSEGNFWDDKHILEQMLADMVKFGRGTFVNPEINNIEVQYRSKLVDSYGKESDGNLMFVSMSRENFEKYNFENIKGKNFYNSVEKDALIFILPSTKKDIDFNNISVTAF
jgi:hypothetical protein